MKNADRLEQFYVNCSAHGVEAVSFYEPDLIDTTGQPGDLTSVITRPVAVDEEKYFKRYRLLAFAPTKRL